MSSFKFSATMRFLSGLVLLPLVFGLAEVSLASGAAEEGKKIAFDRKKGNCLACHYLAGGVTPGNVAPPLVEMKQRFPDRKRLHKILWDITEERPDAMMPPFGKHGILTKDEIEKVVEYLYTQ